MVAQDQCAPEPSQKKWLCVQEKTSPACAKYVAKQPTPWQPDISCQREIQLQARYCNLSALLKQCMRERLTPGCMKQVEAHVGTRADAACKQELQQVAGPCSHSSAASAKQCLLEHLSARCQEQVSVAEQGRQTMLKSCHAASQQLLERCGTDWKKNQSCYKKYNAETRAACRDQFEPPR